MLSGLLCFNNYDLFLMESEYVRKRIKGNQASIQGLVTFSTLQPHPPFLEAHFCLPQREQIIGMYFSRKKEGVCPVCFGVVVTKPVR